MKSNVDGADFEVSLFSSGRLSQDNPMKIVWKNGFIRLVLVAGILWMLLILTALLFHIWSCQSSISFLSGIPRNTSSLFSQLPFPNSITISKVLINGQILAVLCNI